VNQLRNRKIELTEKFLYYKWAKKARVSVCLLTYEKRSLEL